MDHVSQLETHQTPSHRPRLTQKGLKSVTSISIVGPLPVRANKHLPPKSCTSLPQMSPFPGRVCIQTIVTRLLSLGITPSRPVKNKFPAANLVKLVFSVDLCDRPRRPMRSDTSHAGPWCDLAGFSLFASAPRANTRRSGVTYASVMASRSGCVCQMWKLAVVAATRRERCGCSGTSLPRYPRHPWTMCAPRWSRSLHKRVRLVQDR